MVSRGVKGFWRFRVVSRRFEGVLGGFSVFHAVSRGFYVALIYFGRVSRGLWVAFICLVCAMRGFWGFGGLLGRFLRICIGVFGY